MHDAQTVTRTVCTECTEVGVVMNITVIASGSKGNCYVLDGGAGQVLLEAGVPWKKIQQTLNYRSSELAGVLISHEHL